MFTYISILKYCSRSK